MGIERAFLYTVAGLELVAVGGYFLNGNPRLSFIWLCYAAATVALAGVK